MINVRCGECGEVYNEDDLHFTGIQEDEFGRDVAKMKALKWWCFIAAFFVLSFSYIMGYKP